MTAFFSVAATLRDLESEKDRKRKFLIGCKTNAVIRYLSILIADWFVNKARKFAPFSNP